MSRQSDNRSICGRWLYDGDAVLPIDRERNILAAPLKKLWGD